MRYYAPLGVANYGIAADRTEHVLWRIENGEVEGLNPRLIVLEIGTNNLGIVRNQDKLLIFPKFQPLFL